MSVKLDNFTKYSVFTVNDFVKTHYRPVSRERPACRKSSGK